MNRDPLQDFADSPGLPEQIARAVEERELRRMCDADLPQIDRILRFWQANRRPEMFFRIVR